ncbi:MAG: SDR family oxidoreductase [Candidatus Omnitrophica bacterium]|nr:SDR family oxidoreductase [Candidatus Omnitrophota bacterium]
MSENTKKVILITGCSSGFGMLTAVRLSKKHSVVATMRNPEKQKQLIEALENSGGRVSIKKLDVTDINSIKKCVDEVIAQNKRIDGLINNAGYGIGGFFEDLTQEEIRAQFDTNFFGVQNVTREVIPVMRAQKSGKIINISSVAGFYASPCFSAYAASKWALEAFSESLYYELKPFGINVSLIEPGTYNTPIFHDNARFAKNFNNPKSPYYFLSQKLKGIVDDFVAHCRKDPENIAALAEKLIDSDNPSLRNIADLEGKAFYALRKLLPFKAFSFLVTRALSKSSKETSK